ncbi:MAG: glycerol dehydrogenase [Elusimicrobiaceae bacterium]|nr:glycerol dehydrogenase [Elusimicrobiaceae bacterium]
MISKTVFPGRYIQGEGALAELGREAARLGGHAFVLCSPSVLGKIIPTVKKTISEDIRITVAEFGRECTDREIKRVTEAAGNAACDVIIGMGGGKTLDTARIAADTLKLPVISVPTIAATDAPTSAVSVVYTEDGIFDRVISLSSNPQAVLVDTAVIANAPVRFLVSGMGDALATWFEAESCSRSCSLNVAGGQTSLTGLSLARLCYDTLLEFGEAAKTANEARCVTPAFEHVVEANILLSGLGFESGGLGAAHAIHNGLTALPQTHKMQHGEKVAFGLLASLFLTDKPAALINEVYYFCESVGLPTTFADLGLPARVSDTALMKAAAKACLPGESIHNEPMPVSASSVFAAMKAASAYGLKRK